MSCDGDSVTNAVDWELTDVPVPLLSPDLHSFPQCLSSPAHYSFLRALLQTRRNIQRLYCAGAVIFLFVWWKWSRNESQRLLACSDIRKNTHYTHKHSHPPEIQLVTKSWPHQSQPTISWQQTTQKIVVAPRAAQNPLSPQPAPICSTAVYTQTHSVKTSRKDQHQNTDIHPQTTELKRGPAREQSLSRPSRSPIRAALRAFKPIKGLNPPGLDQTPSLSLDEPRPGGREDSLRSEVTFKWTFLLSI